MKNLRISSKNIKKVYDGLKIVHLTGTGIVPVFFVCYVGFKDKEVTIWLT